MRDHHERVRAEKARQRSVLHDFALWRDPVWDTDNEDDVAAALASVDAFLFRPAADTGGDDD